MVPRSTKSPVFSSVMMASVPPPSPDNPDRLAVEKTEHIFDDLRVGTAIIFVGDIADMRGQDHVGCSTQRMAGRQRLLVVDVEPGIGEPAFLQGSDHRVGIADRATRGVNQDRALLHQPDLTSADEAAAARAQHQMYRENVGAAEKLVLLDPFYPLLGPF